MITISQSNYINERLRDLERDVQKNTGLNLIFGVYSASKKIEPALTHNDAVEVISKALGFDVEKIKSGSRGVEIVLVKTVIAGILRENFKISLKEIAEMMGYSNHSTIIHLLESATNLTNSEDTKYISFYNTAMAAIEIK